MHLWEWKLKEPSSGILTAEGLNPGVSGPRTHSGTSPRAARLALWCQSGSGCFVRSGCPFPAEAGWHLPGLLRPTDILDLLPTLVSELSDSASPCLLPYPNTDCEASCLRSPWGNLCQTSPSLAVPELLSSSSQHEAMVASTGNWRSTGQPGPWVLESPLHSPIVCFPASPAPL